MCAGGNDDPVDAAQAETQPPAGGCLTGASAKRGDGVFGGPTGGKTGPKKGASVDAAEAEGALPTAASAQDNKRGSAEDDEPICCAIFELYSYTRVEIKLCIILFLCNRPTKMRFNTI